MSPIPLTKGQRMDHLSERIIKANCQHESNCVDVGAHKGEILDIMLKSSPAGQHFAFEPLPHLHSNLQRDYTMSNVSLFNCALSDETKQSTFQYVKSNPAYSGIRQRIYDRKNEEIEEIEVELKRMDDCIPANVKIDFIKIDVEGAELFTLRGAKRILTDDKPVILFEHGKKGASCYGYNANDLWTFFLGLDYQLHTLKNFIASSEALSLDKLVNHYEIGDEFYFVASAKP